MLVGCDIKILDLGRLLFGFLKVLETRIFERDFFTPNFKQEQTSSINIYMYLKYLFDCGLGYFSPLSKR